MELEDAEVPFDVREGPVVVAYWQGFRQRTAETGLGADLTSVWSIRIYTGLVTYQEMQRDFYAAVWQVLGIVRSQAFVDDLTAIAGTYAGSAALTMDAREPDLDFQEGWALMELTFSVELYGPGTD